LDKCPEETSQICKSQQKVGQFPFSITAGSASVAKQSRTRYKSYLITKMFIEAAILFKLSMTNTETIQIPFISG
jgi:hypothetical protein